MVNCIVVVKVGVVENLVCVDDVDYCLVYWQFVQFYVEIEIGQIIKKWFFVVVCVEVGIGLCYVFQLVRYEVIVVGDVDFQVWEVIQYIVVDQVLEIFGFVVVYVDDGSGFIVVGVGLFILGYGLVVVVYEDWQVEVI